LLIYLYKEAFPHSDTDKDIFIMIARGIKKKATNQK